MLTLNPFHLLFSTIAIQIRFKRFNLKSSSLYSDYLSLFCRFVHDQKARKTKSYLRWNQLIWWASFVAAFVAFGASVYSQHGEDSGPSQSLTFVQFSSLCSTEHALRKVHSQSHFFLFFSGFTKFFPVALACLTLVPCLAAVHWSYSVNPIYAKTRKSVEKPPKDRNTRWVTVWSIFSAFTRIATLALLIFIYYEHWKDVQVSFSKLLEV